MLHLGHCLGAIFFGTGHNGVNDFVTNGSQLLVIAATSIALDGHQIGHHIGGHAPGNNANIGGGFFVNATVTLHIGQGLSGNHHRVDALFRLQTTVGLFAVHLDGITVLPGRPYHDFPGCALAVQGIAHLSAQAGLIHATRAVDTALLRNGEEGLNVPVGCAAFCQQAQTLQNAFHAALVVTAQNGGAIAIEHAVPLHHSGATAGLHAIHMGRKQHCGGAGLSTRQKGPQIAAVAAQFFASVVLLHSKA